MSCASVGKAAKADATLSLANPRFIRDASLCAARAICGVILDLANILLSGGEKSHSTTELILNRCVLP